MASTAVSTLPKAVITTTGRAAFWRLMVCRNSRPFMPGSFKSVRTKSMGFSRSSLRPASASPAENVVNPSSPRFNSSSRRIFASSSTIKIAGIPYLLIPLKCSVLPSEARNPDNRRTPSGLAGILHQSLGVAKPCHNQSALSRITLNSSRNHHLCRVPPRNLLHIERKEQDKASPAHPTLNPNRPSMSIHNLRHNRKSEPHTSFLRRHKRIKNLLP